MIRSTKGALKKPISGVQIRAARSLLGWTRQELAKRAVISDASLYALESARDTPGNAAALTAVRAVLEAAGIELLVNGNAPGVGVRLHAEPRMATVTGNENRRQAHR
jgi:transcriptional regulator with XRE-family HTH domain